MQTWVYFSMFFKEIKPSKLTESSLPVGVRTLGFLTAMRVGRVRPARQEPILQEGG